MKEYVKPSLEIVELRTEERLAGSRDGGSEGGKGQSKEKASCAGGWSSPGKKSGGVKLPGWNR